jgi:hypothetical protein
MPALIASGEIKPVPYQVVEGKDILERAEKSMALLRSNTVSGKRLIWQMDA